jgi:hypothetical protein
MVRCRHRELKGQCGPQAGASRPSGAGHGMQRYDPVLGCQAKRVTKRWIFAPPGRGNSRTAKSALSGAARGVG